MPNNKVIAFFFIYILLYIQYIDASVSCQSFTNGFCQTPEIECPNGWNSKFWDYGCNDSRSKCCTTDP